MSSKFNNKYLLIAIGVLLVLFVFVRFYRSSRTERTLKTDIVALDTAKISKILLYPSSEKGSELTFTRKGKEWSVSNGKLDVETGKNSVPNLLNQLLEIKAKRLVSRSEDKWKEYQLTDSLGTRIKVYEGSRLKLDMYIGKFTYQQTNDPYGGYGGRGGVEGTSYVRMANEDEIYAVDGFLTFSFNQPFSSWRNQTFINLNRSNVTKLSFRYPGDSSFVLALENKKWMVNNQPADSAKVANYLSSLSYKNGSNFNDEFNPVGSSQYQLTIEGNNMENVVVNAYTGSDGKLEMNSSLNSRAWFSSEPNGIFKDVFKGRKAFMPDDIKKK